MFGEMFFEAVGAQAKDADVGRSEATHQRVSERARALQDALHVVDVEPSVGHAARSFNASIKAVRCSSARNHSSPIRQSANVECSRNSSGLSPG